MIEASKQSTTEAWFDDLISTLRTHHIQLETQTADRELKKFYETVFGGNMDELAHLGKVGAQRHFIPRIIVDYLKLIAGHQPLKLAFDFNDSEVLVWAEIKDDDDAMEKVLLKAEAHINSKYHTYGFDMETTIVESGDGLAIPNHYSLYRS